METSTAFDTPPADRSTDRRRLDAYLSRLPLAPSAERTLWVDAQGRVSGRFYGCNLASAYAPIVDVADGRPVGFEALVRSYDPAGQGLSPWGLFELAASDEQLIGLDRLCRTVHVLNFFACDPGRSDLHLKVHGRLLAAVPDDHGNAFRRVLASLGVTTARIVIELPPTVACNETMLAFIAANYRWNGFRVAVTLSSSERLVALARQLNPAFVKLPWARVQALDVRALAASVRETGARLIVTDVEDARVLPAAVPPDMLFAQGHAWGHPGVLPDGRALDV